MFLWECSLNKKSLVLQCGERECFWNEVLLKAPFFPQRFSVFGKTSDNIWFCSYPHSMLVALLNFLSHSAVPQHWTQQHWTLTLTAKKKKKKNTDQRGLLAYWRTAFLFLRPKPNDTSIQPCRHSSRTNERARLILATKWTFHAHNSQ